MRARPRTYPAAHGHDYFCGCPFALRRTATSGSAGAGGPEQYEEKTGRLRYVNCGHLCALLLRRNDTLEKLDPTSTVLGIFKEWDCEMGESRLDSGDTLALYTDGITEAFNHADEEFGEERLVEALRRHREKPSQSLLECVVEEVRGYGPHEQRDDITMIVAKCR